MQSAVNESVLITSPDSKSAGSDSDGRAASREVVQDIRVVMGEQAATDSASTLSTPGTSRDASTTETAAADGVLGTRSMLVRANESFDDVANALPGWALPVGGCLLMFVGAALLTRGMLSRRQAKEAMDPRERALRALGLRAGKAEHVGDVLGAKVLEKMRG